MMVVRMVFSCMILLVLSCKGQKKSPTSHGPTLHENQFSLIVSDFYAPTDSAATLVIRDENSLRKFYAQINKTRKPGLPVPNIDFSDEIIVIRCAGEEENSGEVPELFILEETPEAIILGAKEQQPRKSEAAIISAFSVYRMPYTKKEIIVVPKG